jgi:hypothetical protein
MSETHTNWSSLYKIGGVSALIFIIYSLVTMFLLLTIGGQPESATEAFNLLQTNKLVAFLRLDALTLVIVPIYYPLFLSIYIPIRKSNPSYATLATLLAFAGVTLFLATPSAFSWLSLGNRFSAATTDGQRMQLLAAGEALLASDMWHGSGAMIGGILMLVSALILSIVMLGSESFGKWTAYVGILTHGLDLAHALMSFFAPTVGFILMAIAGPLYLVWFPLLARDFFRLAKKRYP